jgi:kinesin family protein 5
MSSSESGISVCCRFRPTNKVEAGENSRAVVAFASDKALHIDVAQAGHDFAFDRVFPPDSTQHDVFTFAAKPLVDEIMRGYNCTVFVYGQTVRVEPLFGLFSFEHAFA